MEKEKTSDFCCFNATFRFSLFLLYFFQFSLETNNCRTRETERYSSKLSIEKKMTPSLHTLPAELIYQILDHLDPITILLSCRNVCLRLNAIIDTYRRYQVIFALIVNVPFLSNSFCEKNPLFPLILMILISERKITYDKLLHFVVLYQRKVRRELYVDIITKFLDLIISKVYLKTYNSIDIPFKGFEVIIRFHFHTIFNRKNIC